MPRMMGKAGPGAKGWDVARRREGEWKKQQCSRRCANHLCFPTAVLRVGLVGTGVLVGLSVSRGCSLSDPLACAVLTFCPIQKKLPVALA